MEARQLVKSKRLQSILLWTMIVCAIGAVVMGGINIVLSLAEPKASVFLGDGVFAARVADTEEKRAKGLGGVKELQDNEALLMVFPDDGLWSIWMKGMHIPIDIVWLDEKRQVVHIEKDVQPDAPPYDTYVPPKNARYVVELKAGSVQKYKIKMNETAVVDVSAIEAK